MADIQCTQFEFACNTVTGDQTILSNAGYTIKGYILFSFMNTSNATFQIHHNIVVGISDGTESGCITVNSQDAVGSSNSGYSHINEVLEFRSQTVPSSTRDGLASHSSFGSGDDIVINWSDAPSSAWKVYGIAFGGADFECEVNRYTTDIATTGNQSYTTTMSNPEFGFFLSTVSTVTPSSAVDHAPFGIGAAFSASKEGTVCCDTEDGRNTMDTWQFFDEGWTLVAFDPTTGGIAGTATGYAAEFVQWNANGFTLNYTEAPGSASTVFYAMLMKCGGFFDMGVVSKRTSTGDTVITPSNVGDVKGIMLFSDCANTSTSINAHARVSIGVASSDTLEGGGWSADQDAAASAITAKRSEDGNILIMATENDTVGSSTVLALANISAMGTNTFTLTYTTADATAAEIIWWVIGDGTGVAAAAAAEQPKQSHANLFQMFDNRRTNVIGTIFG